MESYHVGETVICEIEIRENGVLTDPDTSILVSVVRKYPSPETIQDFTAMTKDDTGQYHYDFQSAGNDGGIYRFVLKLTDGTRISMAKSYDPDKTTEFELVPVL
jgi:hypothetical protein